MSKPSTLNPRNPQPQSQVERKYDHGGEMEEEEEEKEEVYDAVGGGVGEWEAESRLGMIGSVGMVLSLPLEEVDEVGEGGSICKLCPDACSSIPTSKAYYSAARYHARPFMARPAPF